MKKIFSSIIIIFLISNLAYAKRRFYRYYRRYPALALILKVIGSKSYLLAINKNKILPPASLTKIMTAIIAVEEGNLGDIVKIPKKATYVQRFKLDLKAGEKFYLIDLLKAMLITSANDAAEAIALHIGGTEKRFVRKMNKKAKKLGLRHTHFKNPCGFDARGHYSTAEDLVKLTEYALRNPIINKIVQIKEDYIISLNTYNIYKLKTTNKLMRKYDFIKGVKTGFTFKAGPCLIARAQKDGIDLLLVILHAFKNRWEIAEKYIKWGFRILKRRSAFLVR